MPIARAATTESPRDAASIVGSGLTRRIEVPILSQVQGLAHLFTVKGSDAGAALADSMGGPVPLLSLRQTHGAAVHVVDGRSRASAFADTERPPGLEEGDALVVADPGLAVCVWVADCVPVLICDESTRTAAAIHAGWRGTVKGVLGAAIAVLRSRFGADAGALRVALGPCIGPCCFEVGNEVADALLAAFPEAATCIVGGERTRVDLVEANRLQARAAGVPAGRIQAAGLCTMCRPDLLESYRRGAGNAGRMAGIIGWKGSLEEAG
ncbi:MAG: peptidoglycan editing factor PgeF [Acidobacteria bacterium]|nr:peptidoglycan editing factor PgeF [Acidobacteriota bacterium]